MLWILWIIQNNIILFDLLWIMLYSNSWTILWILSSFLLQLLDVIYCYLVDIRMLHAAWYFSFVVDFVILELICCVWGLCETWSLSNWTGVEEVLLTQGAAAAVAWFHWFWLIASCLLIWIWFIRWLWIFVINMIHSNWFIRFCAFLVLRWFITLFDDDDLVIWKLWRHAFIRARRCLYARKVWSFNLLIINSFLRPVTWIWVLIFHSHFCSCDVGCCFFWLWCFWSQSSLSTFELAVSAWILILISFHAIVVNLLIFLNSQ